MAEYTIDKIEYNGDTFNLSPNVVYATCSTAAATAAKVATITSGTLASLNTGDQVIVKFTYANGKASPTLKVGSTDAKSIMRYGTTAPSTSAASSWNAGSCVWFVYDGTYWQMAGWVNTTYSEISEANITNESGSTTGLVTGRRAKAAVEAFQTDEKLKIDDTITSGTTYYPIIGRGTTAAVRQYDETGLTYSTTPGTAEYQGDATLAVGNNISTGTTDNKRGYLQLFGYGDYSVILGGPTSGESNYYITFPGNAGVVALTSDIPNVSGKIDTAGTGLSKSGTTLNHSNSVTAQTTQAVYPIKIDAQGHISAYGSAVTIPTVPSNIVNTITTTAGAHTAITSSTGAVSFKVPTTAAHVGAAASDHTHGNITNGGDITATAPTIASGDQIIINDHSASKITNGPTFDGSTTTTALTPKGTWESFAKSDTNTTYTLSNALSSHKFTWTLTAGGSGSGSTTTTAELVAGTGITLTDDTTNKKITIASSITNTDEKIKLTSQSTSGTYPLIFGPTSITSNSTYQGYYNTGITVNPSTKTITATTFVGALTGTASGNLTSSSTLDATKLSGTIPAGCYTDTNTTYALSGALSSHKFTSTLTAGGSGSGTSTSDFTLAAGTGITITDDTSNRKMTIACSVTNTDRKLEIGAVTSATTYYPIVGANSTTAATRQFDTTGFEYYPKDGTTSSVGVARLTLGNSTASGTAGNKQGIFKIYGSTAYAHVIQGAPTYERTLTLPNNSGTIALTSDLSNYIPKPTDTGSFGFVLKYITANSTVWDAPDTYEVGAMEDLDNLGTYILTSIPDDVRNAVYNGQKLVLRLLLNSATIGTDTITTDYIFTNCEIEQHYDEGTDVSYIVVCFQGRVNLDEVTVTIYLDETESLYTDGEVIVEKKIAAHAGDNGSEGIVVGGWKICWGTVSLNTNSASGSGTYAAPYYADSSNISLNYTGTPYVWCQVMGGWTGARYATPYDISDTGFKIRLYASAKNSTSTTIRWLSIGAI